MLNYQRVYIYIYPIYPIREYHLYPHDCNDVSLIRNTHVKHPHYISPSEIQKYSTRYLHDCHYTPLNVLLYKLDQSCGSRIMKGTMMGIDAAMDENSTYIHIHISHMYIYIHMHNIVVSKQKIGK